MPTAPLAVLPEVTSQPHPSLCPQGACVHPTCPAPCSQSCFSCPGCVQWPSSSSCPAPSMPTGSEPGTHSLGSSGAPKMQLPRATPIRPEFTPHQCELTAPPAANTPLPCPQRLSEAPGGEGSSCAKILLEGQGAQSKGNRVSHSARGHSGREHPSAGALERELKKTQRQWG